MRITDSKMEWSSNPHFATIFECLYVTPTHFHTNYLATSAAENFVWKWLVWLVYGGVRKWSGAVILTMQQNSNASKKTLHKPIISIRNYIPASVAHVAKLFIWKTEGGNLEAFKFGCIVRITAPLHFAVRNSHLYLFPAKRKHTRQLDRFPGLLPYW